MMDRNFDIIIYGASSLAARYVTKHLSEYDIKLALSGRSIERIKANIAGVTKKDIKIIECETNRIDLITKQTRILINCAGPYIYSGEEIVESCVRNKTHYLDITGETYFIENVIQKYSKKAEENEVYIVNCCGFDCVPADIGVEYFKDYIKKDLKQDNINLLIESILVFKDCAINKTTYESAVLGFGKMKETQKLRKLNQIKCDVRKEKIKNCFFDKDTGSYCTVFHGTDASIVKRTQALLYTKKQVTPCVYHAYMQVGNLFKTCFLAVFGSLFFFLAKSKLGRWFLLKYCYVFTCGMIKNKRPTEEEIIRGRFKFYFTCKQSDKKYKMIVSGPDPAYTTTSACISECAMVLLESLQKQKNDFVYGFEGGVLTPASAFYGPALVSKLMNAGIFFEMVQE